MAKPVSEIRSCELEMEPRMAISRRSLMIGATAAAVGSFNFSRSFARQDDQFSNALKIPPLLDTKPAGEKLYELDAAAGTSEFMPGVATPTIGFNGSYLGPTIRCRAGDHITLRVKNSLSEPTTVHWHGLHIPARSEDVRCSGRTGSACRRVKPSRLTH